MGIRMVLQFFYKSVPCVLCHSKITNVREYVIIKDVSEGSISHVKLAQKSLSDNQLDQPVVLKLMTKFQPESFKTFQKETEILRVNFTPFNHRC
jgi:hypothetical protein